MSKKQELKALREADRRKQNWITIGIIAFGALLIAGVLIWPSLQKKIVQPVSRPNAETTSMGEKTAKVKVEEFSDFQCPFCKQFAIQMEPGLVEKYVKTGKVQWTFVPFSFLGEESVKAAEAAYCASDQGKFWEYHDLIFENQNGENQGTFTRTLFISMAKDLSLDTEKFTQCVDNKTHAKVVEDNRTYGQEKGVNGSPMFIVNGSLVDSSQLESAIEAALAGK